MVWIDQDSNMQSGSLGDLEAAGDDPFTITMDSGIVTLQPRGPGPAPESMLTDTTMDPGTRVQMHPHPSKMHPHPSKDSLIGSNLQPADLTTSPKDTIARLRSEVYTLKFAPPVPLTPTL